MTKKQSRQNNRDRKNELFHNSSFLFDHYILKIRRRSFHKIILLLDVLTWFIYKLQDIVNKQHRKKQEIGKSK